MAYAVVVARLVLEQIRERRLGGRARDARAPVGRAAPSEAVPLLAVRRARVWVWRPVCIAPCVLWRDMCAECGM